MTISATNEGFMQELMTAAQAFNQGDLDPLMSMWAEDGIWITGGTNRHAGRHEGRPAIRRWFEAMAGLGLSAEPIDVLVDDAHVVFFIRIFGTSKNGVEIDQVQANAYRVVDGKLAKGWFLPDDPAGFDRAVV